MEELFLLKLSLAFGEGCAKKGLVVLSKVRFYTCRKRIKRGATHISINNLRSMYDQEV